jgi:hypothetical protein
MQVPLNQPALYRNAEWITGILVKGSGQIVFKKSINDQVKGIIVVMVV